MTDLEKYVIARWKYSIGEDDMENSEYTQLDRTMHLLFPDSPYCNRSWSSDPCPSDLLKKYGLESLIYKVVLTDKTESIPTLNSYLELKQVLGNIKYGRISFKHDGWNVQLSYLDGRRILFQTRGRSCDAIVVEHLMCTFPETIPMLGKITIVMECTVPDDAYAFCVKQFGNKSQRGAVSTLLANKEYSNLLAFHAFDILGCGNIDKFVTLKEWGFKTPEYRDVYSYEDILVAIHEFSAKKKYYGLLTDGLVYKGDITRAIRLEAWEEPIYNSYVLCEDECGRFGYDRPYEEKYGAHRISIGAFIFPIKTNTSTQRRIPLTNIQRILDYNLRPGMPIAFRIASSSIADMDESATKLLQKEYEGREAEYREQIKSEELLKLNM